MVPHFPKISPSEKKKKTISNALIIPTVYFLYPETSGRSLEEMDKIFLKTTSIFDVVSVARKEPRRFGNRGELLVEFSEHEVGITTILGDGSDGVGECGVVKVDDDVDDGGDVEEGRGRRRDGRGRREE